MIKASSLFYALVVTILIAILSSALFLFTYYSNIRIQDIELHKRLINNVDSGLNLLLSNQQSLLSLNETERLQLYDNNLDSVLLTRRFWGAFEVLTCSTLNNKFVKRRAALTGASLTNGSSICMYLCDNEKPLFLSGKTKIKGDVLIPKSGIRTISINGQNYLSDRLIEGKINISNSSFPELKKDFITCIKNYLDGNFNSQLDSVINLVGNLTADSIYNSFFCKTLILKAEHSLKISKGFYSGNIIVYSSKRIIVSKQTQINNCILIAPQILFEDHFNGCLQAFASDSVIIKEGMKLRYPSSIGIFQKNTSRINSVIEFQGNDTVEGGILALNLNGNINYKDDLGIIMPPSSIVVGTVASQGFVDLKGKIYGNIITKKFLSNISSSIYENCLYNSEVDISKLPVGFVSISLFNSRYKKGVVSWVN